MGRLERHWFQWGSVLAEFDDVNPLDAGTRWLRKILYTDGAGFSWLVRVDSFFQGIETLTAGGNFRRAGRCVGVHIFFRRLLGSGTA